MMATKLTRIPIMTYVSSLGKTAQLLSKPIVSGSKPGLCILRQNFANDVKTTTHRVRRSRTLREVAAAPAGPGAFNIGQGVLLGSSVVGLGALCYYGLGMSSEVGAIDRAVVWPQVVRDRVRSTYMYFGGSIAFTALSAAAVYRSPAMFRLVTKNSWMAIGASIAAMIGSGVLVQSIPYREGLGAKQLAWMLHSGVVGAVIAPVCLIGGPLIVRAAVLTAGVVGGLSTVAVCAPSEKFLQMGGPLAIGLGVVFASSLGSMFLSPTSALGAGLYSISMYGGLVLFSMFLLYDTQKIIYKAENYPVMGVRPYDPINASVGIYLDTVNIFIRIAMLLAGGGGNRRK